MLTKYYNSNKNSILIHKMNKKILKINKIIKIKNLMIIDLNQ